MFVCHFVDPGLGVEKEGKQNEEGIDFETGGWGTCSTLVLGFDETFKHSLSASLLFFYAWVIGFFCLPKEGGLFEKLFWLGRTQMNDLGKRFAWGGMGVGGNYE